MCGNGGGAYVNVNNLNITFFEVSITSNSADNTNCIQSDKFDQGRGGGIYYNDNNNYLYIIASVINNNKAIEGGGAYLSNNNKNFVIMDKLTYLNMQCIETSHPYTGYFI